MKKKLIKTFLLITVLFSNLAYSKPNLVCNATTKVAAIIFHSGENLPSLNFDSIGTIVGEVIWKSSATGQAVVLKKITKNGLGLPLRQLVGNIGKDVGNFYIRRPIGPLSLINPLSFNLLSGAKLSNSQQLLMCGYVPPVVKDCFKELVGGGRLFTVPSPIGPVTRTTIIRDCPGLPPGDFTRYFSFTLSNPAPAGSWIVTGFFTGQFNAPPHIHPALIYPSGFIRVNSFSAKAVVQPNGQLAYFIPIGGLPAGKWIIRAERFALSPFTSQKFSVYIMFP